MRQIIASLEVGSGRGGIAARAREAALTFIASIGIHGLQVRYSNRTVRGGLLLTETAHLERVTC